MNYLTLNQLATLDANTKVEVHFSNYDRQINLIKEVRLLTGCGLKEALDIVRGRTMALTVTGPVGVMKVLAMVNNVLNLACADPCNDGYQPCPLTVNFTLYDSKPVFHA